MLSYVCRQFIVRKGRTFLCLLGVAGSVAMIVSILSIARGMKNSLNTYMEESGASLVVFDRSAADLAFSRVSVETIEKVEEIEGVLVAAREAMQRDDSNEIREVTSRLKTASRALAEAIYRQQGKAVNVDEIPADPEVVDGEFAEVRAG